MNAKKRYPTFEKTIVGAITIIVVGSFLLIRGTKEKTDFQNITGRITYLYKYYQDLNKVYIEDDFRYLQIENNPKVFQIFVGKDFGDFKPYFEKIDDLKTGDNIVVYFDENSKETDDRPNKLVQFIDKDGLPYYIRGNQDKKFGIFAIVIGIFFVVLVFYLKKKGIIS